MQRRIRTTMPAEGDRHRLGWRGRVCLVFVAGLVPVAAALGRQAVDVRSPAHGHAAVIAHGIVRAPGSPAAWRAVRREARPVAAATRDGDVELAFLVADQTAVLVWAGRERWRLAPGKAVLVEPGDEPKVASLSGEAAGYFSLELVSAAEAGRPPAGSLLLTGDGFDLPERDYDLDLVRDVLAAEEVTFLDDRGYPVLVLAIVGAITVEAPGAPPVELPAGEAAIAEGELRLTGGPGTTSAFVAAVLGPEIQAAADLE
jgi:hypothetical protein